jgi:transcriptional regulator with XRE-family HTH domain
MLIKTLSHKRNLRDMLAQYSTSSIASSVGVAETTVSNWRSGRSRPARQYWEALAKMFDVEFSEFILYMQRSRENRTSFEYQLVAKRIARLNPYARRIVMSALLLAEELEGLRTGVNENVI